jgi:hypothetical protein
LAAPTVRKTPTALGKRKFSHETEDIHFNSHHYGERAQGASSSLRRDVSERHDLNREHETTFSHVSPGSSVSRKQIADYSGYPIGVVPAAPSDRPSLSLESSSGMDRYDVNLQSLATDDQINHATALENNIAQAPLHNTSDAMGILAQVSEGLDPNKAIRAQQKTSDQTSMQQASRTTYRGHGLHYQPLIDGIMAEETILELFRR